MLDTPVLFLIYRRPDTTQQVFNQIRKALPRQLFVVADGPKPDRPEETELCRQARAIIDQVDWDCEVKTNYSEVNLGCRERVSSGITWFFEHVEEGIILEDDTVPAKSGFLFLAKCLNKFRNYEEIESISLTNNFDGEVYFAKECYLSKYAGIWGWATWKNRWDNHIKNIENMTLDYVNKKSKQNLLSRVEIEYNLRIADYTFSNKVDSWGNYWRLHHIVNNTYCIRPSINMSSNIGFGESSTHTKELSSWKSNRKIYELKPIQIPKNLKYNPLYDQFVVRKECGKLNRIMLLKLKLHNMAMIIYQNLYNDKNNICNKLQYKNVL